MLGATNTSYNDIIGNWTTFVAQKLSLNVTELQNVYNSTADTHNSEMRSRYLWKYAADRTVHATPSAIVNGVLLQNPPFTADDWMKLLGDTYYSRINTLRPPRGEL